ncbi:MAG: ABC transporter permease subunit [Proteobacteria bacterium]|nr:ABC transporter permease subunit [Pseudomonadota bacterium]
MKLQISFPTIIGFRLPDIIVAIFLAGFIGLIFFLGSQWKGDLSSVAEISLEYKYLPLYVVQSISRIFIAYVFSLIFSITYGYLARRNKITQAVLISLLDVLQSIPVLSFLPGVLLAMISLFPDKRIGVELASIILIFTGQVWNMAFSYYNSISTIPKEIEEVAKINRFSKFYKFLKVDLPASSIGLVWNSMMSVAGGWFFLMACEMFIVKGKDFRLPGIGSFIQLSANNGDIKRVLVGLLVMILIIVLLDLLIWKPLVAWSQKFRIDTLVAEDEKESIILDIFRASKIMERLAERIDNFADNLNLTLSKRSRDEGRKKKGVISYLFYFVFSVLTVYFFVKGVLFFIKFFSEIKGDDIFYLLKAGFLSFLRTTSAIIIASLWTIPLGVVIGMKPKVAKILQPVIQIAASVPATALFPIIIYFLIKIGGGLGFGSIFLMLLGTQWYILFNVIAGASAIPQDLRDTAKLYNITGWRKWKVLILPAIFPYLVTGLITATGGAWNASIVSEYVVFGGEVQKTIGLGSLISESSALGNYPILLASTILMSIIVVSLNRLVWKRLFTLAEEKFRLDQ